MKFFSLRSLFADIPKIVVVDVGASDIDGPPPYQRLLDDGSANRVVGFEPHPIAFKRLQAAPPPQVFLPYALGDGKEAVLNVCRAAGLSSLLEPNFELLKFFHGLEEWAQIIERVPVSTRRLDDVREIGGAIDYLKLDVQGSELTILRNAPRTLTRTLLIHLEMPFLPLYRGQPLFADLDLFLRSAGFYPHLFYKLSTRTLKPIVVNKDIRQGIHQVFEADVVYVRRFDEFDKLEVDELLKIALMAHDLWESLDLAALALGAADKKTGLSRQRIYVDALSHTTEQTSG
jgi:FkbM family methyltransferase